MIVKWATENSTSQELYVEILAGSELKTDIVPFLVNYYMLIIKFLAQLSFTVTGNSPFTLFDYRSFGFL